MAWIFWDCMKSPLQNFIKGAAGTVCLSGLILSLSSCTWSGRGTVASRHSAADRARASAELAALARKPAQTAQPALYDWRGDNLAGRPAIRIVLGEQKAYIFRGGQEAGWTYLASGTSAHNTPTGTFTVLEKLARKSSNTYGVMVNSAGNVVNWDARSGRDSVPRGGRFVGASMPYWMRLTSYGIGMHAGPIPRPGLPASHGCIRLPEKMAAKLFEIVEVGTPVTIIGHAPDPHAVLANSGGTWRSGGAE
jgi:hypothetical protein